MYHIIKPDDHLHGTNGNTPRNRMSIVDDNKLNSITNGKSPFSQISRFLERILMEHIQMKNSLESQLQTDSICSIRIRSKY